MVRNLDAEYLEELRANADAVRADLEEREANGSHVTHFDPEAEHDAIMAATRVPMPAIVHKTIEGKCAAPRIFNDNNNGDDQPSTFTAEQIEQLADVLAEFSMQFRMELEDTIDNAVAPLRSRIAVLEGQLSMLTSLLGEKAIQLPNIFEASETVRKLKVQ